MKSKFLFPTWCAIIGYVMAIPGFILGYLNIVNEYEIPGFGFCMREKDSFFQSAFENFTNELVIFLVVIGLILIAFSRNKREDELNAKLRLNSLYWSVMIYYSLYFGVMLYGKVVREVPFLGHNIFEFNVFTPLLIFIVRYAYLRFIKKDRYLIDRPKFLRNKPFRMIGIAIAMGSSILILYTLNAIGSEQNNEIQDYSYLFLILGLMIWAFSELRYEDELMMKQRLESLQLAVYINYVMLLLATLFVYSLLFLYFLLFAQFSLLLFFIIRMEFVNYKNNQLLKLEGELSHEK